MTTTEAKPQRRLTLNGKPNRVRECILGALEDGECWDDEALFTVILGTVPLSGGRDMLRMRMKEQLNDLVREGKILRDGEKRYFLLEPGRLKPKPVALSVVEPETDEAEEVEEMEMTHPPELEAPTVPFVPLMPSVLAKAAAHPPTEIKKPEPPVIEPLKKPRLSLPTPPFIWLARRSIELSHCILSHAESEQPDWKLIQEWTHELQSHTNKLDSIAILSK